MQRWEEQMDETVSQEMCYPAESLGGAVATFSKLGGFGLQWDATWRPAGDMLNTWQHFRATFHVALKCSYALPLGFPIPVLKYLSDSDCIQPPCLIRSLSR
jgi:hypothetical protein